MELCSTTDRDTTTNMLNQIDSKESLITEYDAIKIFKQTLLSNNIHIFLITMLKIKLHQKSYPLQKK